MRSSLLILTTLLASVALSQEANVPVTLGFHNFILPYLMNPDNQALFVTAAFMLGIDSTNFTYNPATGEVIFFVTPAGAENFKNSVCVAGTNPNNNAYLCQLKYIKDASGDVNCDDLNLCNIEIEKPEVPVTLQFHNFILPYLLNPDNQLPFIASAYTLGINSNNYTYDMNSGDITFFVTPTGASNVQKSVCVAHTNPNNNAYLCQLKSIVDASGDTLCDNLTLCSSTEFPNVPVTLGFHNFVLPYLQVPENQSPFILAAYTLGIDSKSFVPDTNTGELTFYVTPTGADNFQKSVCLAHTNPNNEYLCQLKYIKDAEGNVLCDNLTLCSSTEVLNASVTLGFHNFILPYLNIPENQSPFILAAYTLGINSKSFVPNTATGELTFHVTPTGASNFQKSVCLAHANPNNNKYLCQLKYIKDDSGNVLCDDLNLCDIEIEKPEVPVTLQFHKYILPYLLNPENQSPFVMSAFMLGIDSTNFTYDQDSGDITFFVTPTGASNVQKSVCLAGINPNNNAYLCQLKAVKDASGSTLCDDLNLCNITIEPTNVPVTLGFHNFVLPYLNMVENQSPFIAAAYALGIDSKSFVPDTNTGDVTFYVSPTAAENIQKSVCVAHTNPNNAYLCQLKYIKDAEGNTLCDDLTLCGEIEPANVPVTFGFRKNVLLELDGNATNQLAFILAAYELGVDSKSFVPNTATGEITFNVTSEAATAIKENVCEKNVGAGYFCFLSEVKDAAGKTLCADLNPCNISFEDQPPQVVTISINFEDAPFDFDALYAAVARLQAAGGSSNDSSAAPEVVSVILDETGSYFKTVIVNVALPFNSGPSPLLTAICGDSPLISYSLFCNIESIRLTSTNTSLCQDEKLNLCANDKPIQQDFSPRTQMSGLVLLFVLAMLFLF